VINAGASDDVVFTSSAWQATDLKPAFNYHAVFDTTVKIDVSLDVIVRGKTNNEWLVRLQGHKKLDCADRGKLGRFPPLAQRGADFVENYYAGHERSPREMTGQAGMISADAAANLKFHVTKFQSSQQIQQLGGRVIY
jgi:hypothetical protein